ncbi:MAG: DUF1569 domain-containing protein [Phycisphaerales bacterium]|nr:DUF1569 domain-containing protein [Phycisphaerales bacterium]
MPIIDTRRVSNRREVQFSTLDELAAEADRIAQAEAEGHTRALGNWSPGQNLQHLARFMTCSLDGFGKPPPLPVRLFGRVFRLILCGRMLKKPAPAGFKLPKGLPFLPDDHTTAADGARELRDVIDRVRRADPFIPASPLFGKLNREQWIALHLRHAELHLSFVALDR